jgi:AcrR family transcriptional regulator
MTVTAEREVAEVGAVDGENEPAWRERAVSRSLNAARSRAEKRAQGFLDAAFELMDEKGTTDFTIQEVIDRSKQSLRGFYQYFHGKDELLLALFEETVGESVEDLREVIQSEEVPLARMRAFVIRLHEWCDPSEKPRKRGAHNRRPISEFSVQLAADHPDRVKAALAPVSQMLVELIDGAQEAGDIVVADARRTAALVLRTVMYSWFGNRLAQTARLRITAEETWEFCLHGLRATSG